MLVFSSTLLGWVLLTAPAEATERALPPSCETGTRHIELTADAPGKPAEVCIRPELSLTLFFDAKLARVEVAERERFRRVRMLDDMVTLVASEALHDGERVPVTVFFQDGAAPPSATFVLVVHPSQAERQVEVSRRERTLASLRSGEQQARAEAQQCREDKARLQAGCSGQGGLAKLILDGWVGEEGVVTRRLEDLSPRAAVSLEVQSVTSYRAVGREGRARVAVEVMLFNWGTVAWVPSVAVLVGSKGAELTGLTVVPVAPIPPGRKQRVVAEWDVTGIEVRDTFTFTLGSRDEGAGSVRLEGITFP